MPETVNVSNKRPDKEKEMTFVEHLDDLRGHIIRSLIAVFILAIVAFLFKDFIFNNIILHPKDPDFITNKLLCAFSKKISSEALCINQTPFTIINIDMAGQFKAHILVSFIIGVMVAFPYIMWQLWHFLKPALRIREKISIRSTMLAISLLFAIGVLFGYFMIVPLTLNFLNTYQVSSQITNQINFQSYLSVIITLSFSTGLVFELPVLIYFLSKIGIVTPYFLKKQRKKAIVFSFIAAGIITPPDAFSQVLVALPLIGLYEVSIWISSYVSKRRVIEL